MRRIVAYLTLPLLIALACPAAGNVEIISAVHRADKQFPEYMPVWQEGWSAKDESGEKIRYASDSMPKGGYLHVYFRNTGSEPTQVRDLLLDGVSLTEAIAFTNVDSFGEIPAASIHWSKLPKSQIDKAVAAGEPVWWKIEPTSVEPRAYGEVIVRLRRTPKLKSIPVKLITALDSASASAPVGKPGPQSVDISFSEGLDSATLYAFDPAKTGLPPKKVLVDGKDVTKQCVMASDKSCGISPITVSLPKPLEISTYHCLEAIYPNGSRAIAGARAWHMPFVYGMWGQKPGVRQYLADWAAHNVNVHMGMWDKETETFLLSDEGLEFTRKLGMRAMPSWFGNARQPLMYFLLDEPDAHDFDIDGLDLFDRLGVLGQGLLKRMHDLRAKDAKTPQLLNIDNTYKPNNWYTYAQLGDIPCEDPYYTPPMENVSLSTPEEVAFHIKPTYVYAAASILQSARAPKPMHVLLLSSPTEYAKGSILRFPTAEEKQLEIAYVLGAGAKGLSYWWYTTGAAGADHPGAKALYRGIGLLGGQTRTLGPLIIRSTPAELPVKADPKLWIRTLVVGLDTVLVLVANNDVVCDRLGTVVRPVAAAKVTAALPSWLTPKAAFEATCDGTQDAKWTCSDGAITLDLAKVEVTRMIVVTSNPDLRMQLQKLYDEKFAANVAKLKEER